MSCWLPVVQGTGGDVRHTTRVALATDRVSARYTAPACRDRSECRCVSIQLSKSNTATAAPQDPIFITTQSSICCQLLFHGTADTSTSVIDMLFIVMS